LKHDFSELQARFKALSESRSDAEREAQDALKRAAELEVERDEQRKAAEQSGGRCRELAASLREARERAGGTQ